MPHHRHRMHRPDHCGPVDRIAPDMRQGVGLGNGAPAEIAQSVRECYDAGACLAHMHARDAQGIQSTDPAIVTQINAHVRAACPVIIQNSIAPAMGAAPEDADTGLRTLDAYTQSIPKGAKFSTLGVGPAQHPATVLSLILGGGVRVGFEDSITYRRGQPATSNAQLVERKVTTIRDLGLEPATPEEARDMLGIPQLGTPQ